MGTVGANASLLNSVIYQENELILRRVNVCDTSSKLTGSI